MSTSVKIFRPWASSAVPDHRPEEGPSEPRGSAFTRVPEPGHPASEFQAMYGSPWSGHGLSADEWSASMHTLPLPTAADLAHVSSYLDPAYLSYAFAEMYGGAKAAAAATAAKLKQRPKKFRCPHCKVSFSNNGQLKGHVRIHTGERPFKCDSEKCGKSFTRNEELTRHKRIHTGLRPFPCDQCGKRFGRKDHLKKHIRTHFPQPRFLDANLISLYPVLFGY